MQPALSLVVFTVTAGTGYGLLFLLAGLALAGELSGSPRLPVTGLVLAFTLITLGLASSMFHLGHPGRAWRAFSQWRSSWLSREAVAAAATYPVGGLFALAWVYAEASGDQVGPVREGWVVLALSTAALATAALAIVTVVCTAMIYASLKPIPRWRNRWIVPNFLALALMCGALWLASLDQLLGDAGPTLTWLAAGSVALAFFLKSAYWYRTDRTTGMSTMETATGLGCFGKVRLIEAPYSSDNFVMEELGYGMSRKRVGLLRLVTAVVSFVIPLMLTLGVAFSPGSLTSAVMVVATLVAMAGVVLERWLFFAEANHVVNLYYGRPLS